MSENTAIENVRETAMVDLAYDLLKQKGEPIMYHDIMSQVASLKEYTEKDIEKYVAQLYTDINVDGRFTCVGRGLWGLKDWYPIEQTTESAVAANVKEDDYLDDEIEEVYEEEPEQVIEDSVEIDDLDDDLDDDTEEDEPLIEGEVDLDDEDLDDEDDEEDDEDDVFDEEIKEV